MKGNRLHFDDLFDLFDLFTGESRVVEILGYPPRDGVSVVMYPSPRSQLTTYWGKGLSKCP